MLTGVIVYLSLSYIAVLLLGYLQTPETLPTNQTENKYSTLYSSLAITAVSVQAFMTILLLRGTPWFPASTVFLAFTIISHHLIIHRNSKFEGDTCSSAAFQAKDITTHGTWVVASLVAGVVSLLHL